MTPEDGHTSWQAPTYGRVKINIDETFFSDPNKYSHAQIDGILIEAMSKCYSGDVYPKLAEAMGNVVIETDCLAVVH